LTSFPLISIESSFAPQSFYICRLFRIIVAIRFTHFTSLSAYGLAPAMRLQCTRNFSRSQDMLHFIVAYCSQFRELQNGPAEAHADSLSRNAILVFR
jgi:hypothetical protein